VFEQGFIDKLAEAVAAKMITLGVVAPRLMSLEQAASYLGMTVDALRYKATTRQIQGVKADKKWRFDKIDLDRWIEDHKQPI
jgi:excisionase family DNA binding protein